MGQYDYYFNEDQLDAMRSGGVQPVSYPGLTVAMDTIFSDIAEERARQDEQWGGPEHDDQHSHWVWADILGKQVGLARVTNYMPGNDFRGRMVKIAAIAVAAIEAHDRKEKGQAR